MIGKDHYLPLADSIIYATALKYKCTLWTTDQHFEKLPWMEARRPAMDGEGPPSYLTFVISPNKHRGDQHRYEILYPIGYNYY
jgi:hypothetical protein